MNYDELQLIKAAHNGSTKAEDTLYSYHKKNLEESLHKYNSFLDDLTHQIDYNYRIAIHKYNVESKVTFINFASWFIKNTLERKCADIYELSNLATHSAPDFV